MKRLFYKTLKFTRKNSDLLPRIEKLETILNNRTHNEIIEKINESINLSRKNSNDIASLNTKIDKKFENVDKKFDLIDKKFEKIYYTVILTLLGMVGYFFKEFFQNLFNLKIFDKSK
jgi:hypothetical protein